MNDKKGQVSFFIILAVIILGAVSIFLFFSGKIYLDEQIHPNVQPVHDFVLTCLEYSTREAVKSIGLSGGYYPRSDQSTESGVVYYSDSGEKIIPPKKIIQESISLYIEDFMPFCIDNFKDFTDVDIQRGSMNASAEIRDNTIFVNLNYPLTVSKGEAVYTLSNFKTKTPVRLNTILSVSEKITDEHINTNAVCIDCLGRFSDENGLVIAFDDYNNNTIIYTIFDEYSLNETYAFLFAIKSDSEEINNEETIFWN